jgi:hypothetical protein
VYKGDSLNLWHFSYNDFFARRAWEGPMDMQKKEKTKTTDSIKHLDICSVLILYLWVTKGKFECVGFPFLDGKQDRD